MSQAPTGGVFLLLMKRIMVGTMDVTSSPISAPQSFIFTALTTCSNDPAGSTKPDKAMMPSNAWPSAIILAVLPKIVFRLIFCFFWMRFHTGKSTEPTTSVTRAKKLPPWMDVSTCHERTGIGSANDTPMMARMVRIAEVIE